MFVGVYDDSVGVFFCLEIDDLVMEFFVEFLDWDSWKLEIVVDDFVIGIGNGVVCFGWCCEGGGSKIWNGEGGENVEDFCVVVWVYL